MSARLNRLLAAALQAHAQLNACRELLAERDARVGRYITPVLDELRDAIHEAQGRPSTEGSPSNG